jgi:hypothetical protein
MATPTSLPAAFVSGDVLTADQQNNLRGAFRVLNIDSVNVTAKTFTTGSTSFTNITGLTLTITPQSTSNKILIFSSLQFGADGSIAEYFAIARNGTIVGSGTDASNVSLISSNATVGTCSFMYLDSPASVAALTYTIQVKVSGGNMYLNRRGATDLYNGASNLTIAEISA